MNLSLNPFFSLLERFEEYQSNIGELKEGRNGQMVYLKCKTEGLTIFMLTPYTIM